MKPTYKLGNSAKKGSITGKLFVKQCLETIKVNQEKNGDYVFTLMASKVVILASLFLGDVTQSEVNLQ